MMQQEQFSKQAHATATTTAQQLDLADPADVGADMPQCCGTGCTVCVLDYPELFSNTPAGNQVDSETLAQMAIMLEAIEQAQLQAQLQCGQLPAETSGELQ